VYEEMWCGTLRVKEYGETAVWVFLPRPDAFLRTFLDTFVSIFTSCDSQRIISAITSFLRDYL
jgi:hypothetical protein